MPRMSMLKDSRKKARKRNKFLNFCDREREPNYDECQA